MESPKKATLLGEGERDLDSLHNDGDEEWEGVRPTCVERVHDAALQVRAQGQSGMTKFEKSRGHELKVSPHCSMTPTVPVTYC